MNRKLPGMLITAFAFCLAISCSDRSTSDPTGLALNDSTAVSALAVTKPSPVTDLQDSVTGSTSVTLSFTQVDDGTGQPAKYDVRYAVSPIQWGAATSTTSGTCTTPVPGTATGTQLSCTVLGLTPSTNYNFQLVPFRGTMNLNAVYGPLSNIVSATTTASAPPPPAPVASVSVLPASSTLQIGATVQLLVTARDANDSVLTGRVVTSSSADAAIASVNSLGLVTAVSAGTTEITVTSEGKSATATIIVSAAAPVPIASVTVSPTTSTLVIGATVQLLVTAFDVSNNVLTGRIVTSSSADPGIASVNSLGLVTAVSAGTTQITVTSEGKSAIATITVSATAPPAVKPSAVTNLQASATGSSSVTLSFTQVDDGTGQPAKYDVRYAVAPISWGTATSATSGTCSTPVAGTATGSQLSCTVLGLTPATNYNFQLIAFRGTMNLNAVYGPLSNIVSATTTASAPPPPVPVASVSVSPASSSLLIGATVQLLVTARDANGNVLTGRVVTSSSANAAIASVNSLGLVTAVSAGTTQITVTSEGQSAIATIIVTAPPPPPVPVASVSVSPATSNLIIGATVQLLVTARDANGNVLTGRVVTSSSANAGIASVNSLGLVTAVSAGTTGITVTSEGQSAIATINVSAPAPVPVATVSVSPTSSSLLIGAQAQLAATTRDASNNVLTGRTVSWSSSNTSISTVSASGLVTAVGAGSATVTATSETKTGAAAITVSAPAPAPVASVTVSPATATLQVGGTVQLAAVTRDANNNVLTGRAVSWTSSNTGVATVSASGLVSALAAGPAQITAISENQSGSATVTVSAPPPPPPPSGSAEPAGMTRITENDFTAPNQDGWYFEYGQVNAATVQDASAPRSPSGVLQLTYPAGMTGGTGPNSLENDWSAGTYKTLYISSWMKVSSNFYGHCGPDVTKTLHVWVSDGTTSGNRLYSNVRGCGTEALSYWVNLQGVVAGGDVDNGTSAELAPNLGQPATIVRGQWQKYELVIKANSAGTRDGTVDWWLDGVHVGSYTGIQFVPGNATWDLMKWNPTWGGLGGVVPADFTESMDHIYVSGKR